MMQRRKLLCLWLLISLIFLGSEIGYSQFNINPPPSGDPNPYTLADARGFFGDLHVESENYHDITVTADGTWENYTHLNLNIVFFSDYMKLRN